MSRSRGGQNEMDKRLGLREELQERLTYFRRVAVLDRTATEVELKAPN